MLNSKQRAYLRGLSNKLNPIFQVGKAGCSEEQTKQIGNALEARELIKINILENSGYMPREAAQIIADGCQAEIVTVLGNKAILYKESQTKKNNNSPDRIILP